MEERKGLDREQEIPEEEYSFLQEVIKDEAGSGRKRRSRILRMAGLGMVFGIVACITFCALRPWLEPRFGNDPEKVTIPQDDEEEEPDGEEAPEDKPAQDAESYRQMLQSLKEVSREAGKSIVEITGISAADEWTKELNDSKHSVSGIIVADNGQELLILSKTCPVKNPKSIRVTFPGGARHEASVKARDGNLGLTVYAVPRTEIEEDTWSKIDMAVLGNSNLVNTGDAAIVLGKPFGYANAYTYGVVTPDKTSVNLPDGQYEVIYTDVSGSDGASGVLVNIRGEVVGIVEQTILEENSRNLIAGYGISDIKNVIQMLSNGQSVPYIGIYGVDVTEDLENQGLPKGLYVKKVEADSPAMAAGIQNGDVLTGVGDTEITGVSDYHEILMKTERGSEVVLKGRRQGSGGEYVDIDFTVTVGAKE